MTIRISTFSDIEFKLTEDVVGVTLSGGIDSAVMLRYLSTEFPDVTFIPFHGMENLRPQTVEAVQRILDHIPSPNIEDMVVYPIYSKVVYSEKKRGMDEQGKVPQMNDFYNSYGLQEIVMAMNCLPNKEVLSQWGCDYYSPDRMRRDRPIYERFDNFHYYKPIVNHDKRITKELFDYLGLDDDFLSLTSSCTGFPHETNYYTKPCGKCYHCHEKSWVFGKL